MTTLPSWTDADWSQQIAEPFRSDREFWNGLAASADAVIALVAAAAVAVVLALTGHALWALTPFAVPGVLAVRAGFISRSSSRRSRDQFAERQDWRDAERTAVASAFGKALSRTRGR
jgi:hypothetical protein